MFVPIVIALALTASACGSSAEAPDTSVDTEAQKLRERVGKLESEAEKREAAADRKLKAAKRKAAAAERKARRAKRERAREREKAALAVAADGAGGDIVVPNVVGLDHQAAQDAMQGEGLWLLDEEDCTGQGRMLLFDRNWEVVRTDPPAGTRVTEDTTITLCSKKQGE